MYKSTSVHFTQKKKNYKLGNQSEDNAGDHDRKTLPYRVAFESREGLKKIKGGYLTDRVIFFFCLENALLFSSSFFLDSTKKTKTLKFTHTNQDKSA